MRNGELAWLLGCEMVTLALSLTRRTGLLQIFRVKGAFRGGGVFQDLASVVLVRNIVGVRIDLFARSCVLIQTDLAGGLSSLSKA